MPKIKEISLDLRRRIADAHKAGDIAGAQRTSSPQWNTVVRVLCCGGGSVCQELGAEKVEETLKKDIFTLSSNMTTNQKIRGPCQKTIKYQGAWEILQGIRGRDHSGDVSKTTTNYCKLVTNNKDRHLTISIILTQVVWRFCEIILFLWTK